MSSLGTVSHLKFLFLLPTTGMDFPELIDGFDSWIVSMKHYSFVHIEDCPWLGHSG